MSALIQVHECNDCPFAHENGTCSGGASGVMEYGRPNNCPLNSGPVVVEAVPPDVALNMDAVSLLRRAASQLYADADMDEYSDAYEMAEEIDDWLREVAS